jgi:hypothetical protein
MTFRATCSRCKTYPVSGGYDATTCFRCQREQASLRDELDREAEAWAAHRAQQRKPQSPALECCTSCMSTLNVQGGLCMRCQAIRQRLRQPEHSLAASYGPGRTKPASEPDAIY